MPTPKKSVSTPRLVTVTKEELLAAMEPLLELFADLDTLFSTTALNDRPDISLKRVYRLTKACRQALDPEFTSYGQLLEENRARGRPGAGDDRPRRRQRKA
jgi:hypothetical protein